MTIHKIDDNLIIDPTREEEDVSEARMTIGSYEGVISSIQKGESSSLSVDEVNKILDIIEKAQSKVFKKIEKYLK